MPGALTERPAFFFVRPPHVILSSRAVSNYSIVPAFGRRPFPARQHHKRLSEPTFRGGCADEATVRPDRTALCFHAARRGAANSCLGCGRRIPLPLFLSSERATFRYERMECLARPQFEKLDRSFWRFFRHLQSSGR